MRRTGSKSVDRQARRSILAAHPQLHRFAKNEICCENQSPAISHSHSAISAKPLIFLTFH
jgi:hypothetical protein